MKILETIRGAVVNTVIYEDEAGEKRVVAKPSAIPVEAIVADLNGGAKVEKTAPTTSEKGEEKPIGQKTVFSVPEGDSDASKDGISKNAQPERNDSQKDK